MSLVHLTHLRMAPWLADYGIQIIWKGKLGIETGSYKTRRSGLTSASREVPLRLHGEEGEGQRDGGASADGDQDGVGVESGHHRAEHEALGHWKWQKTVTHRERERPTNLIYLLAFRSWIIWPSFASAVQFIIYGQADWKLSKSQNKLRPGFADKRRIVKQL